MNDNLLLYWDTSGNSSRTFILWFYSKHPNYLSRFSCCVSASLRSPALTQQPHPVYKTDRFCLISLVHVACSDLPDTDIWNLLPMFYTPVQSLSDLRNWGWSNQTQLDCNHFCVLLWQDPPVTEPLLNVHESAPSRASSWAMQIPATKRIHLVLVFFACLFLLIILSTASWKGEKNSLAHFLIHTLQIPHWQPLFLVLI